MLVTEHVFCMGIICVDRPILERMGDVPQSLVELPWADAHYALAENCMQSRAPRQVSHDGSGPDSRESLPCCKKNAHVPVDSDGAVQFRFSGHGLCLPKGQNEHTYSRFRTTDQRRETVSTPGFVQTSCEADVF